MLVCVVAVGELVLAASANIHPLPSWSHMSPSACAGSLCCFFGDGETKHAEPIAVAQAEVQIASLAISMFIVITRGIVRGVYRPKSSILERSLAQLPS